MSLLTKIFSVKDPNLEILYVPPAQLMPEVQGYIHKILEMDDLNESINRIHIIVPENADKFT